MGRFLPDRAIGWRRIRRPLRCPRRAPRRGCDLPAMMQVVILAGGLGTRLGPIAARMPKALVPVNGRPFLAHVIDLLKEHGLTDLLVLHGHHGDQLERTFGDGTSSGVRLSFRHDGPRLLGTGGALRSALPQLEDEFLVLYGDTYLDIDYRP